MSSAPFRAILSALALTASAIAPSAKACEEDIALERIRVHLFYAYSGQWSDDLLAREEHFLGWNTPIGGGDAGEIGESADDLMVVVEIGSTGQVFTNDPLEIWISDEVGGEIARRDFSGVLTSEKGKGAFALFYPDGTCSGGITVHAKFRGEEKTGQLQLYCGE
ncbi:MAG: hypothetical protein WAT93_00495 [Pontixanthobacter sp.]